MPIDPTIALRLKPLEVPSPLDSAARVMSLRNLMNQGDLQTLQVEQATLSAKKRQALTESIANMTAEQANDPAFIRKLMLEHAEPSDLAKYLAEERAAQKPTSIGAGGLRMPGGEIIPPAARPQVAQQPSSLARLLAERDALPQGDPRRAIYDQGITHATNPQQQRIIIPSQPPAPHFERGVDEQGRQVVHVFDRSGKLIKTTPLKTKPAAGRAAGQITPEQAAEIVNTEGTTLLGIIKTNPKSAASLLSGPSRGVEALWGLADETYSGPALKAQAAKQRLLFAVDQLVKSGKSSNEFLRRLESALGMQGVTSPGNATTAINEAIALTKQLGGGAQQPPKAPTDPARPETKVLNGKTYIKINGQWFEK